MKLISVMPATNFSSERRSTMTQERLNHLMLLHIHKDIMIQFSFLMLQIDLLVTQEKDFWKVLMCSYHLLLFLSSIIIPIIYYYSYHLLLFLSSIIIPIIYYYSYHLLLFLSSIIIPIIYYYSYHLLLFLSSITILIIYYYSHHL